MVLKLGLRVAKTLVCWLSKVQLRRMAGRRRKSTRNQTRPAKLKRADRTGVDGSTHDAASRGHSGMRVQITYRTDRSCASSGNAGCRRRHVGLLALAATAAAFVELEDELDQLGPPPPVWSVAVVVPGTACEARRQRGVASRLVAAIARLDDGRVRANTELAAAAAVVQLQHTPRETVSAALQQGARGCLVRTWQQASVHEPSCGATEKSQAAPSETQAPPHHPGPARRGLDEAKSRRCLECAYVPQYWPHTVHDGPHGHLPLSSLQARREFPLKATRNDRLRSGPCSAQRLPLRRSGIPLTMVCRRSVGHADRTARHERPPPVRPTPAAAPRQAGWRAPACRQPCAAAARRPERGHSEELERPQEANNASAR